MAWTPQRIWYHCISRLVRVVTTFGFHLTVEGQENVPPSGPYLLLANHASFLDPTTIGCGLTRSLYYLARSTLWKNPYFGALLTSVNAVPVNQEGPAHEGLKAVMTKLQEGEGMLLFPEGTRTDDGDMKPLQPGVLLIIRRLEFSFPVIPVGIAGTYAAWPMHQRLPYTSPLIFPPAERGPLAVSFGKPVDSTFYKGLDKQAALQDMHARIHTQWQRAERIRRKPSD